MMKDNELIEKVISE